MPASYVFVGLPRTMKRPPALLNSGHRQLRVRRKCILILDCAIRNDPVCLRHENLHPLYYQRTVVDKSMHGQNAEHVASMASPSPPPLPPAIDASAPTRRSSEVRCTTLL